MKDNSVSNNSGAEFLLLKGKLDKPINGNLTSRYGGNNKGLTFSARSKSQVTSPINGIIEFSGAFKNYNNIVIIMQVKDTLLYSQE